MLFLRRDVFLSAFVLVALAAAAAQAQDRQLSNPRAAMRTFIDASKAEDYQTAAEVLDFGNIAKPLSEAAQQQAARKLKAVLDREWYVDYQKLPDDPNAEPFGIPPGETEQPLELAKSADGSWRFSAATVANADALYAKYQDAPLLAGPSPWYQDMKVGDNALWRIGALFLAILLAFMIARITRAVLTRMATSFERRQRLMMGATFRAFAKSVGFVLFVFGLKLGVAFLVLNSTVLAIVGTCLSILMALAAGVIAWNMVSVSDTWLRGIAARTSSTLDDMLVPMVRASLRVTVIVLVLVQIATILSDKPVTSVIAGLGVGGLAIGLAAQDMIKNFFGSIMIFSDRPFELGERIVVGDIDGPVELVGFRSTRIRTLDGHLVTIPNGELANKAIRNVSKRPNIKRAFDLGVTYDTTPEKLKQAKQIVEEILADHEGMDAEMPPRVFFNNFNDSALNLSVVYWYHPADWWSYCEFTERVNMQILERFNAEQIEFAFPSQTIYLAGEESEGEKK